MRLERLTVAVALPLLLWVGSLGLAEHGWRSTEVWQFPIAGFDPRDLLRGHYIRFRIDVHELEPMVACDSNERYDCSLCLRRTDDTVVATARRAPLEIARANCDAAVLLGDVVGEQRFYIPEARAQELDQRVRGAVGEHKASVEVSIDHDGRLQIRQLLVDGTPIL